MFFTIFLLLAPATFGSNITDILNAMNLINAINAENIDKVKELVQMGFVRFNTKHYDGWDVLHQAALSNVEIMRFLLSHGADKFVNDKVVWGNSVVTPLLSACCAVTERYEMMEALLKFGGDPNVTNENLRAPLHFVRNGSDARLLISYGAKVDAKDILGYTPALNSVIEQRPEVLYALADGRADFAITCDNGDTIFHVNTGPRDAFWTRELVSLVPRSGAPLNALNNNTGETALTKRLKRDAFFNLEGENPEGMYENTKNSFYAYMAEAGADMSAPNRRGETLLLLAVLNYRAGLAKWLLENGARVEAKNAEGDTPLLALVKQERWNHLGRLKMYNRLPSKEETAKIRRVIDVLVDGGADVYAKDEDGCDTTYHLRNSGLTWMDCSIEKSLKKNRFRRKWFPKFC